MWLCDSTVYINIKFNKKDVFLVQELCVEFNLVKC